MTRIRVALAAILCFATFASAAHADDQLKYVDPPVPKLLPPNTPSFAPLDDEVDRFIRVPEARAEFSVSGQGLAVAVVDTGVNNVHISFDGQLLPGRNFSTEGGADDTIDRHGHGSHVAGIIAAKAVAPSERMPTGIAPGAKIIPLKVFPNGQFESIRAALQWILDNQEAYLADHGVLLSVVNLSLATVENITIGYGGEEPQRKSVAELLRQLRARGIVVTVSAGNQYFKFMSSEGMGFPAICPETVSVGAVFDGVYNPRPDGLPLARYESGATVSFGRTGRCVAFSQRLSETLGKSNRTDVFAPGFIVTSTGPVVKTQDASRTRTIQDGTSQAAPTTAGVVLLLQDYYRLLNKSTQTNSPALPSVDLIEECLRNGGVPFSDVEDAEGREMDNVTSCGQNFVQLDALGSMRYLQSRLPSTIDQSLKSLQADLLQAPSTELADVVKRRTTVAQQDSADSTSKRLCLVLGTTVLVQGDAKADINRIADLMTLGAEQTGLDMARPAPAIGLYQKATLMDMIDSSDAAEDATLVCYLKLHGGTDTEGVHTMRFDSVNGQRPETVVRSEVIERLLRQHARLTILITESCSNSPIITIPVTTAAPSFPKELFHNLFVVPRGLTDINSSTFSRNGRVLNQAAWMDVDGAIFTRAFTTAFTVQGTRQTEMLQRVKQEGGGRFNWQGFSSYLSGETTAEFRRIKQTSLAAMARGDLDLGDDRLQLESQEDQFPQAFTLAR